MSSKRKAEEASGSGSEESSSEEEDRRERRKKKEKKSKKSKDKDSKRKKVKEPISEDDYYEKSSEFQTWLHEEKGLHFDELKGSKAHRYFAKFVDQWNRGRLSKKYYAGIQATALAPADRTSYRWNFVKKAEENAGSSDAKKRRTETDEPSERIGADLHYERKRFNARHDVVMDELAPKPTTAFEKKMVAKQARRAEKAERELSPAMDERDIYGDGGDRWLAQKKAQREVRNVRRVEVANAKLAEYQAKEEERMAMFRAMAQSFQQQQ